MIALFAIAAVLIFLKTSAFLGEGFFRIGQTNQQYILAYYNQAQNINLSALQQIKNEISTFSGTTLTARCRELYECEGSEIRSKYPGANQIDLLELAEKERQSEIRKLLMR